MNEIEFRNLNSSKKKKKKKKNAICETVLLLSKQTSRSCENHCVSLIKNKQAFKRDKHNFKTLMKQIKDTDVLIPKSSFVKKTPSNNRMQTEHEKRILVRFQQVQWIAFFLRSRVESYKPTLEENSAVIIFTKKKNLSASSEYGGRGGCDNKWVWVLTVVCGFHFVVGLLVFVGGCGREVCACAVLFRLLALLLKLLLLLLALQFLQLKTKHTHSKWTRLHIQKLKKRCFATVFFFFFFFARAIKVVKGMIFWQTKGTLCHLSFFSTLTWHIHALDMRCQAEGGRRLSADPVYMHHGRTVPLGYLVQSGLSL